MHASSQQHFSIFIVIATNSDADHWGGGGGGDDLQFWTFWSVIVQLLTDIGGYDSRLVPIIGRDTAKILRDNPSSPPEFAPPKPG